MSAAFRAGAVALNLAILLTIFVSLNCHAVFKLTNVKCNMVDKDFGHFEYCRLKAIRRNVAAFSFKLVLHEVVRDCLVHVDWLRRYSGYKPFLINQTLDACKFIKNPKSNPYFWALHNVFAHASNLNHSCPYDGTILLDNYYPEYRYLLLPVPTGEYLLKSLWIVKNKARLSIDTWYTFEDPNDLGK